ncbi:hypothetical protein [Parazoarcus communis]|uniref:hypothetical protein n=1 Tax=Parazoarcus communis TaxID=41977 RepID=UPI001F2A433B|nr:hypothetical protein [Parazoarcus communis]
MATIEDHCRHTANALVQPGIFGLAHIDGKALITEVCRKTRQFRSSRPALLDFQTEGFRP